MCFFIFFAGGTYSALAKKMPLFGLNDGGVITLFLVKTRKQFVGEGLIITTLCSLICLLFFYLMKLIKR